MTGSRATGIACLAGTKAVSSRHRRSPLVLCSTTHRGSSRDSLILVVGGRHRKGSAIPAVPHLVQLQSPTYQWVLTGLPGSTWGSARGTDLYRLSWTPKMRQLAKVEPCP